MRVDVLLEQISVAENGTSHKSCPGLLLIHWLPVGEVQPSNPVSRKLALQDDTPRTFAGYQDQFVLRAEVTGKCWVEAQVISMTDFGVLAKLIPEVIDLAKKSWPLPIGASLLDYISDDVKKGAPQVIATGKSQVLEPDAVLRQVTIDLQAPADVLGDMSPPTDPVTGLPTEGGAQRPVLLPKGAPNGSVVLTIAAA